MLNLKDKVVYQIYPKSFYDSDSDGIGDLQGIIKKLNYIKSLNVNYIWLTPIFSSPHRDNGYDVSCYTQIHPAFGTMDDMDELIEKAEKLNIGIMLDMVFNHTSTEHEWFKNAMNGDKKYQKFYIFRDGNPDTPPNAWQSKFGGSAWEYVPKLKKWYLHLFDVTQADLNWRNPEVRNELKKIILFWKNKKIKGFRFDVINLISKPEDFSDNGVFPENKNYTDRPEVHQYLKELIRDTQIENLMTTGELSSTDIGNAVKYSSPKENELKTVFHFHHLKIDYLNGQKWKLQKPDICELKNIFTNWQTRMQTAGSCDTLFWCNHDQSRIVSRLGSEKGRNWQRSAKMLAACIHLMNGVPYIYQGEEIGMTNPGFNSIEHFVDVESLNFYKIMINNGIKAREALKILNNRSRDNSRTPMQWNNKRYAGFSKSIPWIKISAKYKKINVRRQNMNLNSVLNFYRKLVNLRKTSKLIQEGIIEFNNTVNPYVVCYKRRLENEELLCLFNFSGKKQKLNWAQEKYEKNQAFLQILSNYNKKSQRRLVLPKKIKPWELIVLNRTPALK